MNLARGTITFKIDVYVGALFIANIIIVALICGVLNQMLCRNEGNEMNLNTVVSPEMFAYKYRRYFPFGFDFKSLSGDERTLMMDMTFKDPNTAFILKVLGFSYGYLRCDNILSQAFNSLIVGLFLWSTGGIILNWFGLFGVKERVRKINFKKLEKAFT